MATPLGRQHIGGGACPPKHRAILTRARPNVCISARRPKAAAAAASAVATAAPPPTAQPPLAPPPALAPASAPAPHHHASSSSPAGHSTLLHGLGDVGDVPPGHMPALLRAAHSAERRRRALDRRARAEEAAAAAAADADADADADNAPSSSSSSHHHHHQQHQLLPEFARGYCEWRAALAEGLLPACADEHLMMAAGAAAGAATASGQGGGAGAGAGSAIWPPEPLRTTLVRAMAKLGVARFASKYPAVREALMRSVLDAVAAFEQQATPPEWADEASPDDNSTLKQQQLEDAEDVDGDGEKYKTAADLAAEDLERRAKRAAAARSLGAETTAADDAALGKLRARDATALKAARRAERRDARLAALGPERRAAVESARALYEKWEPAATALDRAGRAFEGLEALLGGEGFGVSGEAARLWQREGWGALDDLRQRLERLKELRDLVRSLGRGGGWGPLRRAPIQRLDMRGRPGLLRTTLEAQETRGLTRSGDLGRLLPAEAATLARGRRVRQSRLLFFARLAEQGLQTYQRDGWGEFPTRVPAYDRREVRPTADRGPILLCVDTSGSMRGARETVAKALALECMRAAREQERGCYVFAFAGPKDVRELELGQDAAGVGALLDFVEATFNGGSDFNEPLRRCLDRLSEAEWANSDVLLVSDGELRQPSGEIMRKLAGAKEALALRVHGLVVGAPSADSPRRADPAVLRSLCTSRVPGDRSGRTEVLVSLFEGWESVRADEGGLGDVDWDDSEGNARRRLAGLAAEAARQKEMRRRRSGAKQADARAGSGAAAKKQSANMGGFGGKTEKVGGGGGGSVGGGAGGMPGEAGSATGPAVPGTGVEVPEVGEKAESRVKVVIGKRRQAAT